MAKYIDADELEKTFLMETAWAHSAHDVRLMQMVRSVIRTMPAADVVEVQHGHWIMKHRHRGGFRTVTGVDEFGVQHTITIDERYETDDPYCSECGALAGDMKQDHCCVCKAVMGEKESEC